MDHTTLKVEFDEWFTIKGQSNIVTRIKEALSKLSIDELREERLRAMNSDEGYWIVVHAHISDLTHDLPPFWMDKEKFDNEEYRSVYYQLVEEMKR